MFFFFLSYNYLIYIFFVFHLGIINKYRLHFLSFIFTTNTVQCNKIAIETNFTEVSSSSSFIFHLKLNFSHFNIFFTQFFVQHEKHSHYNFSTKIGLKGFKAFFLHKTTNFFLTILHDNLSFIEVMFISLNLRFFLFYNILFKKFPLNGIWLIFCLILLGNTAWNTNG